MASTWDTFRKSDFVVIFLTSLWLCVVLQYYLPMLMLLPLALIPGVGTHWYRRITGVYDAEWGRFSCLAIPMSWCNTNIVMTDYDFLMKFKANVSTEKTRPIRWGKKTKNISICFAWCTFICNFSGDRTTTLQSLARPKIISRRLMS